MSYSKIVKIILCVIFALFSNCTTNTYRVYNKNDGQTEVIVTPDRVLVECEDIKDHENASDPAGNYGFMIHVLDEENTVWNAIRGSVIDRKTCFEQKKHIEKILQNGKQIYLGGMGTLDDPREKTTSKYTFPNKGIFSWNGRVLGFRVIQNELGECYDVYYGSKAPCPREEFPIKDHPFIKVSK